MKTLILSIALGILTLTGFSQKTKKAGTIVLVHGAWADASAWNTVTPLLQAKGYEVIAVNLPGHGKDTTPFTSITMQSYVDAVKAAIGTKNNVLLVGHSMAGLIISEVAEAIPSQIKELVYLVAVLPQNGVSLLQLSQQDADSHTGKYIKVDEATASIGLAKEGLIDVFAADASKEIQDYLLANVKADPLIPFTNPVTITAANFGSVKRAYIHTINDNAISYAAQQAMVKSVGVNKEYALKSSHTPFFSMPKELADIILKEAK